MVPSTGELVPKSCSQYNTENECLEDVVWAFLEDIFVDDIHTDVTVEPSEDNLERLLHHLKALQLLSSPLCSGALDHVCWICIL